MKKVYRLIDLECANCAAKIEKALGKMEGVENAAVNFMTQKLTLEAEESQLERILAEAQTLIAKIEPHCKIVL